MPRRGRRAAVALVGAVVLLLGPVACDGTGPSAADDFTGRCVGGTLLVDGLDDPVDVIGTAADPLHVVAHVDPALVPRPGDQVTVVTAALPPPGITAIVTAVGPPVGGAAPVTISVWPRDDLAQTFVPGVAARVTLHRHVIGKSETISVDSLRPPPPRLPGPSTLWVAGPGPGDGPLEGRAHPVAVTVGQIARGRATFTTSDPAFPPFGAGQTWPIVVPDRHCGDSAPGPSGTRVWDVQSGGLPPTVEPTPLPSASPPPGAPGPGADEQHQSWERPVGELDVDDPLDADGGVEVVAADPGRLDVTLALRWRGARPVLAEDWVGPYDQRFWEGGDTRRSAVGCAPAGGALGHPCSARYSVAMPPTAVLRAHTTDAPIDVRGLTRRTALSTVAGPVTLDGVSGDVSVLSATGDVSGTVAGRVGGSPDDAGQVTVGSGGRIDLRVTVPPRSLTVTGGRGPVTVEVPRGAAYEIDTDAFPTGRRDLTVPSDPAATHLVTVRSDGEVTVRYSP